MQFTISVKNFQKICAQTSGAIGTNTTMLILENLFIELKDNHIDFCGGITQAITQTTTYLKENNITFAQHYYQNSR
mgnify:CR=1 FL=1